MAIAKQHRAGAVLGGNRRKDFDAEIYNRILGARHHGVVFVSGGSSSQVQNTGVSISEALNLILPTLKLWSLADRDNTSDAEVTRRAARRVITLPLRNLESFLLADDVIEALVTREQKQALLADALRLKHEALAASVARGNPSDDWKSAAGEIYNGLKTLLSLQRCGNNADAFMRDTLAPLIAPPMPTYQALKAAIVDKIQ